MKLEVKSGNGTRVRIEHALPTDRLLVSDWEVTLLVGVSAAKRTQWTAAWCAAWCAAHGGAQ